MRLRSPFDGQRAGDIADPGKSDPPRGGIEARDRHRRAAGRPQPAMNIIEQRRDLMAVEAMEQPHRFDRGLGRVLPVAQSVGNEERVNAAVCWRRSRNPRTRLRPASRSKPHPSRNATRRVRGLALAGLDARQHGGADARPGRDIDEIAIGESPRRDRCPRCRRSNSRPRGRLRHLPCRGPRSRARTSTPLPSPSS